MLFREVTPAIGTMDWHSKKSHKTKKTHTSSRSRRTKRSRRKHSW